MTEIPLRAQFEHERTPAAPTAPAAKKGPCFSPTTKHDASSISACQSSDLQNSLARQGIHSHGDAKTM
jgi:hypothetical protein